MLAWLLPLSILAQAGSGSPSGKVESTAVTVDFRHEVWPIIARHCLDCHGPTQADAGLRLDRLDSVQRGGISGHGLLGGNPDTNELVRRVTDADAARRMPKGADPLSAGEIETLKRWVRSGAVWNAPVTEAESPAVAALPPRLTPLQELRAFPRFTPFAIVALWLLLFTLWSLRGRERARLAGVPFRGWSADRWFAIWIVFLTILSFDAMRHLFDRREREIAMLRQRILEFSQSVRSDEPATVTTVFGDPPIPLRMTHPKALSRIYYRGNCERSEALFNGGNYLTSTIELSLRDANDRPLKVGDALPTGAGPRVVVEIVRAPGTAGGFFEGESIPRGAFLHDRSLPQIALRRDAPIKLFRATRPDWRWRAEWPVTVRGDGQHRGLFYLLQGSVTDDRVQGSIHYGIVHELVVKDGRLDPASDLWMGSLTVSPVIALPDRGKVPAVEWFDWRPLPVIEGENTKDPKLLGLPGANAPPATGGS
jgi:hypothetical protein